MSTRFHRIVASLLCCGERYVITSVPIKECLMDEKSDIFDSELSKEILEDLEWERDNAIQNGFKPETAFTSMMMYFCSQATKLAVEGSEHKHYVAAIWDMVNAEMSRIEALEDGLSLTSMELSEESFEDFVIKLSKEGGLIGGVWHTNEEIQQIKDSAIKPDQHYYHTEIGIFDGLEYSLQYQIHHDRYVVKVKGVESVITPEAVEDYPDSCLEHRIIKDYRDRKRSEPAGFQIYDKGPKPYHGEVSKYWVIPPIPPAPQAQAEPEQAAIPDPEPAPAKTADNDDFLKPSTLTKNILRDWGQL